MNQQQPHDPAASGGQPTPPAGGQAGGFGDQGAQPTGQQPAGGQPVTGGQASVPAQPSVAQPPKPVDPNARTGQLGKRDGNLFTIPPHPNTQFDEENFLTLLEGSISLTMEEKQRVIDAIPRLSIEQINELISIFTEEKQKFAELENEFADDVAKLKAEREKEMQLTEMKQEEAGAEEDDKAAAEALKKQMGL